MSRLGALVVVAALLAGAGCAGAKHQAASSTTDSVPDAIAPADSMPAPTTIDPGTLPQTRDHPGTTDDQFTAGVQALGRAVVADDPQQAMPFFFPLSAYLQVKALPDPAHDWQTRLVAAFDRDVHAMHARLGADASQATLVGLDVPDPAATWVDPGQESNKLGYWRVYGSQLQFAVGTRTVSLPIYSLISWRGEWYVVHVSHP